MGGLGRREGAIPPSPAPVPQQFSSFPLSESLEQANGTHTLIAFALLEIGVFLKWQRAWFSYKSLLSWTKWDQVYPGFVTVGCMIHSSCSKDKVDPRIAEHWLTQFANSEGIPWWKNWNNDFVNPFTPKIDQFQISPAASPGILHHTV